MSKLPLSLPMSQIIASDAPLLSPVSMGDHHWDMQQPLFSPTGDNFNFNYYTLPPSPPSSVGSMNADSPIPAPRMLKARMSPDTASEAEQLCVPTHQLFDFPQPPTPPSPAPSLPSEQRRMSISLDSPSVPAAAKRSASPTPSAPRKRTVGERINSKDFIPPDVSGLSKREARLVKNRAAAFLSRQRKREEFECMEVRVAELEQENARLLALTKSGNSSSPPKTQSDNELVSEIEQLRNQLAAARERELELSAVLASKSATGDVPIKVEAPETQFPLSSPLRSSSITSTHKSGASFGLMVLLCALPTLLSMPLHSTAPTSFSIPNPIPASSSSTFDFNSFVPSEYDWSRTTGASAMDFDSGNQGRMAASSAASAIRRLEFSGAETEEFGGLGGLDISFDASPSDDGKIRVRIHPSSSASSRETSPGASYSSSKSETSSSSPSIGMWSPSDSEPSFEASFSSQPNGGGSAAFPTSLSSTEDPFLGVGASNDFGLPYTSSASSMMYDQMSDLPTSLEYGQLSDASFGLGSEYSVGDSTTGGKRRVRIALKSMPASGGEGGEWEVQIC